MSKDLSATWMRGGTSKGLFLMERDLPRARAERDALLLRLIGSPDPYQRQTDGLGGATSSTSKVVLIGPSHRDDCDVDYYFGAVSITDPVIDFSGNCGNLSAAVGPFAIAAGLVPAVEPQTRVRIWQRNLGLRIDAWVPVRDGRVVESGHFQEDGVPFPSAEIRLQFHEPASVPGASRMLPTGQVSEWLEVPGHGRFEVTLITSGNPTVFLAAQSLGLSGVEMPDAVNRDKRLLERLEAIRAQAAVRMELAETAAAATRLRPATPKISWVAAPRAYRSSAGREVAASDIDLVARIMSMGRLHHAYTGTGSIALAAAAALPGSVVNRVCNLLPGLPTRIGHVSGALAVGAELEHTPAGWQMRHATLSRSARRLMTGLVHLSD